MERFSSVPVKKESTVGWPGKNSRHQPATRSKAAWSRVVRSAMDRLYRAPPSIRLISARVSVQPARDLSWAMGRST